MSTRRISPSARVCLVFALFVCVLSLGQTALFFLAFRRFRSDFEGRLTSVETAPPSVVSNVVYASASGSSTNVPSRPRFLGAGYVRATRFLYPYADIDRDGHVSRHYLDPLPVSETNLAKYVVSNIKASLRDYR